MKALPCRLNRRAVFSIFTPNNGERRLKADLVRHFLIKLPLKADMDSVTLAEGSTWVLYADKELAHYWNGGNAFGQQIPIVCICSFQKFADGEQIVIARLWRDDKKTNAKQPHASTTSSNTHYTASEIIQGIR